MRNIITKNLTHIEESSFLNALKTIIQSKTIEGTYKLSDYQKKRIDLGQEQLEKGQTITDVSLKREVEQWLFKR